jgi:hypothetical protein
MYLRTPRGDRGDGLRTECSIADPQYPDPQARSSVGEHYLDTVGVGSSILPAPTAHSTLSRNAGSIAAAERVGPTALGPRSS